MSKIPVMVLYGGRSTEHEVSCRSAAFILRNLDPNKYETIPVAIDKSGQWLPQDRSEILGERDATVAIIRKQAANRDELLSRKDLVVFPMLHGTFGEDGTIQGLLDLAEVAYVGADTTGAAIGMDKIISKKLAADAGLPIVPYVEIRAGEWEKNKDQLLAACERTLSYPMFVKPARLGSSVGITKVKSGRTELVKACETALSFDDKILVETGLNVRELECAILGGTSPEASVVGEIDVTSADFYDYAAKYEDPNAAKIIIPANLSAAVSENVRDLALKVFSALNLYGLARIDLFLVRGTESDLYFNEVNTMPGFTSISQYPMLWKASGVDGPRLIDRLITLATERQLRRKNLLRSV
jgi:D-alanine-D-alanine ligase